MRHRDPDDERRNRDQEPGDRSRDADVEQDSLGRNRLANLDERAERADDRERKREEIREGRVDVIITAREVVSELVAAQDGDDRSAVPQATEQELPDRHRIPEAVSRKNPR